jgi:hypothetical protein
MEIVYPDAILYVFVIMTICTTAVSCIHFVLFGTLQSKWLLILCVTCFGLAEFVSVRQIFTSCLTECPTLFQLSGSLRSIQTSICMTSKCYTKCSRCQSTLLQFAIINAIVGNYKLKISVKCRQC